MRGDAARCHGFAGRGAFRQFQDDEVLDIRQGVNDFNAQAQSFS